MYVLVTVIFLSFRPKYKTISLMLIKTNLFNKSIDSNASMAGDFVNHKKLKK